MLPGPGEVLHFSEDPSIRRFVPHVAATAEDRRPLVWAVDARRAPDYWFPRACPRVLAWRRPSTRAEDAVRVLGPGGGERVHAVEYAWLDRMRTARVHAYRLPAAPFRPVDGTPEPYAMVSTETVEPLGSPEPVGDLLALHEQAGIQLRVLPVLWTFWDAVTTTTMGFSGIRLRNARPRRDS